MGKLVVFVVLLAHSHLLCAHNSPQDIAQNFEDGDLELLELREAALVDFQNEEAGAEAEAGSEKEDGELTEAVFERGKMKTDDEMQDRLWRTPGNPDGTGGSTIVLSNINQLEAAQGKLKDHKEEAEKRRRRRDQQVKQEEAEKAAQKESNQKKMARLDKHTREKLKQQQHDSEREACSRPQLKNLVYTFQARNDPHTYLQHQSSRGVVDKTRQPQDKNRASFVVEPGLADAGYVSLRSLDKPGHYLRHQHWQLRLSKKEGGNTFKNEATFRLVKGLVGCRDGYVSFETNVKGKYLVNKDGQVLVASVTEDTKKFASFRPITGLGQLYYSFLGRGYVPVKNRVIAPANKLPRPADRSQSWMVWIQPTGIERHWGNLFFKGGSNQQRNPAVWFYPGRTRLHIRSGSTSSWNSGMDPPDDLPRNKWTHVAFVHTFGKIWVYYNGKLAGKISIGAPLFNNGALYSSDPWHRPGKARLADLRYYPREATVDEITQAVSQATHQ